MQAVRDFRLRQIFIMFDFGGSAVAEREVSSKLNTQVFSEEERKLFSEGGNSHLRRRIS